MPSPSPTPNLVLGAPWDSTFAAAALAATIALLSLVWNIVSFILTRVRLHHLEKQDRARTERTIWFDHYQRASILLLSDSRRELDQGLDQMNELVDSPMAAGLDLAMASAALKAARERVGAKP